MAWKVSTPKSQTVHCLLITEPWRGKTTHHGDAFDGNARVAKFFAVASSSFGPQYNTIK